MSGMSIAQAQARLGFIREQALRMNEVGNTLLGLSNQVQNALDGIAGSGISPERMPSTRMLANEIKGKQEEQRARIHSLLQGIEAMRG